jgi:hypothetical protein
MPGSSQLGVLEQISGSFPSVDIGIVTRDRGINGYPQYVGGIKLTVRS